MKSFFLPYTAFQYASAVRAIKSGIWQPTEIFLLHGAGTTSTESGRLYLDAFLKAAGEFNIPVNVRNASVFQYFKSAFQIQSAELVTGNLRRSQSLYLGFAAQSIVLLDDGLGSILSGGYLDPEAAERSMLKRIANHLRILPQYKSVCKKVSINPTIFPQSIFQNMQVMPFVPVIKLSAQDIDTVPDCIFICSLIEGTAEKNNAYIEWAQTVFELPKNTYLSIHPQTSENEAKQFSRALGKPILDTQGVLIEEYVFSLSDSAHLIEIIGQKNTSTEILEQAGFSKIQIALFAQ